MTGNPPFELGDGRARLSTLSICEYTILHQVAGGGTTIAATAQLGDGVRPRMLGAPGAVGLGKTRIVGMRRRDRRSGCHSGKGVSRRIAGRRRDGRVTAGSKMTERRHGAQREGERGGK